MPISISLNVTKLDKRKFVEGKKGLYANITLWETEGESAEYGDFLVKQTGKGDDRMPILGNAKYFKPRPRRDDRRGGGYGQPERGNGGGRRDDYEPRPSSQHRDDERGIPF